MQKLAAIIDVHQMLLSFLNEDIGIGDITSQSMIPAGKNSKAKIFCKSQKRQTVVLSGIQEAQMIFGMCGCISASKFTEGSKIHNGDIILEISGKARSILKAERTALNVLMRMSGIATETLNFVTEARRDNPKIQILATRKTAPGMRYLDKKAVAAGGGGTHRMRLDDMVLIKDNHLQLVGSVAECIQKARLLNGTSVKIECEARNRSEAISALRSGAECVMLDNFSPSECRKTIQEITKKGLRKRAKIELSGGINLNNIRRYAKSRPDYISIGHITHSAPAIDFSLEIV